MKLLLLVVAFFFSIPFSAFSQQMSYLWSKDKMPNSKGLAKEDSIANDRIYRVAHPSVVCCRPSKEENTHFAVLIIPGGGYARLAHIVSGSQLAKWINSLGGTAYVLNYRLPNDPDLIDRETVPLQDAQRAMRIVRSQASQFDFDPNKIGVLGTSAGGHLASCLGTFDRDFALTGDSLDRVSFRPDFMTLISPVITLADPLAHKGSRENLLGTKSTDANVIDAYSTHLKVNSNTPPTLLIHADNDKSVPVQNSVLFYSALLQHGVSASLHIFPFGGHAVNLTKSPGSTRYWSTIVDAWLDEMNFKTK